MSTINGSSTTAVEVEEELDLEIEETERETARVLEALKKNKAKFAKEKEPVRLPKCIRLLIPISSSCKRDT